MYVWEEKTAIAVSNIEFVWIDSIKINIYKNGNYLDSL